MTGRLRSARALGLMSSPYLGLAAGSTGDAVRQLQQRLIDRGIAVAGGADGVFGPGTTAAVKEYQRQLGYYPSGTVNAAGLIPRNFERPKLAPPFVCSSRPFSTRAETWAALLTRTSAPPLSPMRNTDSAAGSA